jgi:hypothetical protein
VTAIWRGSTHQASGHRFGDLDGPHAPGEGQGGGVEYGGIFIPGPELVFCLIAASDEAMPRQAPALAGVSVAHLVEFVVIYPQGVQRHVRCGCGCSNRWR